MRRSARLKQNQAFTENDADMGHIIKKSRSDNKTSNIATLDNVTMVETLKYLNYMELAKSSLTSKRFSTLIRTHRHSLALLDVDRFSMGGFNYGKMLNKVKVFDKEFSPEAYAEWVDRNGYSKKIIHAGRVAKMQRKQCGYQFYEMRAVYRDSIQYLNGVKTTVFYARKELNHKNWPLFQHFVRLLTDPFVYIRHLKLIPLIDVFFLNLLAGVTNPYHNRIQCSRFDFYLQGYVQKLLDWTKNHVHCNELCFSYQSGSHFEEAILDFFMTGAHCTSATDFNNCHIPHVIVAFLQKFMNLKSCDKNEMIESIRCCPADRVVELLNANYAKFIVKEEKYNDRTVILFELINNDIGKHLQITTRTILNTMFDETDFLLEIKNL